jgi:phosphatidylglycerophosphatase A
VIHIQKIIVFLGSFAYTGFFPFAPATFSSLVFALLYVFVPGGAVLASPYLFFPLLVLSVPIATRMERRYGHDAHCITIDEIVAMQLILMNTHAGAAGAAAAFFLFRIFDVTKPFPAGRSQKLPGGFGVVADDIIAGCYTRLVLAGFSLVFPGLGRFGW